MKKLAACVAAFLLCGVHAASAQALPSNSREFFPKLPQSNLCTKDILPGAWKLLMVYESPPAAEMTLYASRPLQYYLFDSAGRYGDYVSSLRDISIDDIRKEVARQQTNLQQYVVNDAGMLFFYKDSIAIDSLACFIVAQDSGPFESGQMLLMPPQRAAKGRMVKVYQKVWAETEQAK